MHFSVIKNNKFKYIRFLCVLAVAIACFLCFSTVLNAASLSASDIISTEAPHSPLTSDLDIIGYIPFASIDSNVALTRRLNAHFLQQYNSFISEHLHSALSLSFTTNVYSSNNYISVVVIATAVSASSSSSVLTTVIYAPTGDIVSLSDLDDSALSVINAYISNRITQSPRSFSAGFTGIDSTHPFYIKDNLLIVPFASSSIFSGQRDIYTMSFSLYNIQTAVIEEDMYTVLPPSQYNAIMVQLTRVIKMLGYTFEWNIRERSVDIFRGSTLVSTVTVGKNSFFYENSSPRELESPPVLSDSGYIMVPLSFFNDIMNVVVYVSPNGQIIMSIYNADDQGYTLDNTVTVY